MITKSEVAAAEQSVAAEKHHLPEDEANLEVNS
jgi:hypothetical protein